MLFLSPNDVTTLTSYHFSVYILTDKNKRLLDIGIAGNLCYKLQEFEGRHPIPLCIYLLYWENYLDAQEALKRCQQIESLSNIKKKRLIETVNPEWKFLNEKVNKNSLL